MYNRTREDDENALVTATANHVGQPEDVIKEWLKCIVLPTRAVVLQDKDAIIKINYESQPQEEDMHEPCTGLHPKHYGY